eukprot:CAMPEP_0180164862 /NCGR_PEP_ID=MMETSP0986-20121125/30626_1 /TAXON_ID=697907 /ORGANISM="non described non described, Strain CCMP2293" /LENGTH=35 /DNA_ID= /DNA_START= /DNA_END= /DNA_ORIENTATION=
MSQSRSASSASAAHPRLMYARARFLLTSHTSLMKV